MDNNQVSTDAGCPKCGNRDADTLVWDDSYEYVTCSCGHEYVPACLPDSDDAWLIACGEGVE